MRRPLVILFALTFAGAAAAWVTWEKRHSPLVPPATTEQDPKRVSENQDPPEEDQGELHFRLPQGTATHVTCKEARRIIAQVRTELSYEPDAVDDHEFAASVGDWLDPHSFWSLPEDAPTQETIDASAHLLIAELESRNVDGCAAAKDVGKTLAAWSRQLRASFDRGVTAAPDIPHSEEKDLPAGEATLPRAEELGKRAQAFRGAIGIGAEPYIAAARDRFFPDYDQDTWAEVVLAAAVRAYVPLVDPHGAWAPLDEKSSVYEVDLFANPPEKPWGKVTVTAVGFRIDDHADAPLADGDIVLRVNGTATAGMPLEQIEQLGFASRQSGPATITIARQGALKDLAVPVRAAEESDPSTSEAPHLVTERLPYGNEEVAVIAFQDVRDDLGEDIRDVLLDLSRDNVLGVILDLRGNGGGSTDGAINALGYFIPNAALFPTKRRDGTIEIDRSPQTSPTWDGPVATLVDGSTASAAEMIAGALTAYGRGPSVGASTFGKGCAQEYLDDEASVGVLRLTTLLYALPDGTPVQRIGLTPTIKLPFLAKTDDPREREATLKHTAPTWRGPDRRTAALLTHHDTWTWPGNAGKIGPCVDADVCRALKALGSHRPQIAKNKPDAH